MQSSIINLSLAVLGLLLAAATLLVLKNESEQKWSRIVRPWIHWMSQSRIKAASFLERSEEKGNVMKQSSCIADHKDHFPPSTRVMLPRAVKSLPEAHRKVSMDELKKNLIAFEADYRQCGPSTYTPTGMSIEEIAALGDFPDYATLSGVPLPDPYQDFEITKAKARPYRPFRWAYHQTMCMQHLLFFHCNPFLNASHD